MDISLKLEMILNILRINMSRVHFFKLAGVMFVACILTGCKADGLEVKLSGKDIASAIDGEEVTVDFEAEFSLFGELDEETKATLDQLLTLSEEYLVLDDVEIVKDDFTTKVLIEGSMPLTINGEEKSPWFIQISPKGEFYSVQLTTGLRYERLAKDMGDINFLLSASKSTVTSSPSIADAMSLSLSFTSSPSALHPVRIHATNITPASLKE